MTKMTMTMKISMVRIRMMMTMIMTMMKTRIVMMRMTAMMMMMMMHSKWDFSTTPESSSCGFCFAPCAHKGNEAGIGQALKTAFENLGWAKSEFLRDLRVLESRAMPITHVYVNLNGHPPYPSTHAPCQYKQLLWRITNLSCFSSVSPRTSWNKKRWSSGNHQF